MMTLLAHARYFVAYHEGLFITNESIITLRLFNIKKFIKKVILMKVYFSKILPSMKTKKAGRLILIRG